MKAQIDDETLMAYVDGELAPAEAEDVRARLAADPEARAREAVFRESAAALRGAFDAPLREAMPERFTAIFRDQPGTRTGTETRAPRRWYVPASLAAGIMLAVGVGVGWLVHGLLPGAPPADQAVALLHGRMPGVQAALETAPSGSPRSWHSADGRLGGRITPVLSFLGRKGRPCREYRQTVGTGRDAPMLSGVACRSTSGHWSVRLLVAESAAGSHPSAGSDTYAPAGGQAPRADSLLDTLITGAPLTPGEEARMIRDGWKPSR